MKIIFRQVIYLIIGLGLLGSSLVLDNSVLKKDVSAISFVNVINKGSDAKISSNKDEFDLKSGTQDPFEIRLFDSMVVRGLPNTELNGKKDTSLALKNGRIWLYSRDSAKSTKITAGIFTMYAEPGAFDISYDGKILTATAARRSFVVEFLEKKLVVPEKNRIVLDSGKIERLNEKINKLRYSKLVKEFPVTTYQPEDWMTKNHDLDQILHKDQRDRIVNEIRSKGPRLGFNDESLTFKLGRALSAAIIQFTFDAEDKAKRDADAQFAYFDAGVYAQVLGKEDIARKRFATFQRVSQSVPRDMRLKEASERFEQLAFASPGDDLYEQQVEIRKIIHTDPLTQTHIALNDVLDAYDNSSQLEAEKVVQNLLSQFHELSRASFFDTAQTNELLFELIRFNNFLERDDKLLREEYLATSWQMEQAYLKLNTDQEELADEQQTLIKEKLTRIGKIKALLEQDKVQFQDGRKAILALLSQIETLRPILSDTAVLSYFDDELLKLRPLISFFRSSSADKIKNDFTQNFEDYKKRTKEAQEVQSLLKDSEGGLDISPFRREELVDKINNDLQDVGLSSIKLRLPDDEYSPLVFIDDARFEEHIFRGTYDTEKELFSSVTIDDQIIANAIKRDNLRVFVMVKTGKLQLPKTIEEESLTEAPTKESVKRQIVRKQLQDLFGELSISVDDKYIGLEDVDSLVAHVRLALIGQGLEAIVFSFDIDVKTKMVSKLSVQTIGGPVKVEELIPLKSLPEKVRLLSQKAIFEQEQKENLKKELKKE